MEYRFPFPKLTGNGQLSTGLRTICQPESLTSVLIHGLMLMAFFSAGTLSQKQNKDIVWIKLNSVYIPKPDLLKEESPAPLQSEPQVVEAPRVPLVTPAQNRLPDDLQPPTPEPLVSVKQPIATVTRIRPAKTKIKQTTAEYPNTIKRIKPSPVEDDQTLLSEQEKQQDLHQQPAKQVFSLPPVQGGQVVEKTPVQSAVHKEHSYLQANFEEIRRKVSESLRYPTMARRLGWTGKVQLRFTILLSGEIARPEIISGSRFPLLNRKALEAVERAAPFPQPPVVTTITIPVTFELR